jgi:hypothetical protein
MQGTQIAGMAGIAAPIGSGCPFKQADTRALFGRDDGGNEPGLPAARDKDIVMVMECFHEGVTF